MFDFVKVNLSRSGESIVYGWDLNFNGDLFMFNELFIYVVFGIEVWWEELKDILLLDL